MKQKIAYQGIAGAYSHIAATNIFPNSDYIACPTFAKAFALVQDNKADYAVIPVENSNAGRVSDVHFLLPQTKLFIWGEYFLKVEHQLLGLKNSCLKDIKTAFSHPQALAQCNHFLDTADISPAAEIDTAFSCSKIKELNNKSCAAIASKLAAQIYDLKILASDIQNANTNTTRFLIMSSQPCSLQNSNTLITSLVFRTKNIPSALYAALGCFALNNVNITKLESYLLDGKFVSAQFYIEVESHPVDDALKKSLRELDLYSEEIHLLGTYPAHPYRTQQN